MDIEYEEKLQNYLQNNENQAKSPEPESNYTDLDADDTNLDDYIDTADMEDVEDVENAENIDDENDNEDFEDNESNENDLSELQTDTSTNTSILPMGQGTEESMRREELSHTNDRKLTRLIQLYPSIWCTKHPDYGNFEVTRKHWRAIAVHFSRTENIKVRWKNIRKRYVRIEQRIQDGKRFMGYFDKATNFLANRNLTPEQWIEVDCGLDDGDIYEREKVDNMEVEGELEETPKNDTNLYTTQSLERTYENDLRPIDILPIDLRIINYVKRNVILWRRAGISEGYDHATVRNVWMQLWRTMTNISFDDMVFRWHYLYEMYKTFRLKKIKDKVLLANFELKYSKYLSKLYFLYKIDEDVLRNECNMISDDMLELDEFSEQLDFPVEELCQTITEKILKDKSFVVQLYRNISQFSEIYDMLHANYTDAQARLNAWGHISIRLVRFKCEYK